jgi:hypothetical protein
LFKSRDGKTEERLNLEKGEDLVAGLKRLQGMGWIIPPAGKLLKQSDANGVEYITTREKTETKKEESDEGQEVPGE